MERPPVDYYICPCCGTEFGYEDFADTDKQREKRWEELRERWLSRSAPWFSPVIPPPPGWNPVTQLFSAKLAYAIKVRPEHAFTSNKIELSDNFWTTESPRVEYFA